VTGFFTTKRGALCLLPGVGTQTTFSKLLLKPADVCFSCNLFTGACVLKPTLSTTPREVGIGCQNAHFPPSIVERPISHGIQAAVPLSPEGQAIKTRLTTQYGQNYQLTAPIGPPASKIS
jgi:hypothetical protein